MVSMGIPGAQPWYQIDYLWAGEENNDFSYVDIGWKVLVNLNVHISIEYFLISFTKHERTNVHEMGKWMIVGEIRAILEITTS